MDSCKKCVVLGASRGLGLELVQLLCPHSQVLAVSRNPSTQWPEAQLEFFRCDLSKADQVDLLIERVLDFSPDQIIYVAGGGPYGLFLEQKWPAHQWAFDVTFLTPARILHVCSQSPTLKQFVYVGSVVAESQGDPGAASYAAAKHAWLGLQQSLSQEKSPLDVRTYSPGYMDTAMLPPKTWPRLQPHKLWSPAEVARDLLEWTLKPSSNGQHRVLSMFSEG